MLEDIKKSFKFRLELLTENKGKSWAMFRRDLLPILEDIREIRFGVETYINLYFQAEGKRIQYVLLDGLSHPNTFEKESTLRATKKYLKEGQEIALTYLNNHKLIVKRIDNQIRKISEARSDVY